MLSIFIADLHGETKIGNPVAVWGDTPLSTDDVLLYLKSPYLVAMAGHLTTLY
jgi:hypothetical protein